MASCSDLDLSDVLYGHEITSIRYIFFTQLMSARKT